MIDLITYLPGDYPYPSEYVKACLHSRGMVITESTVLIRVHADHSQIHGRRQHQDTFIHNVTQLIPSLNYAYITETYRFLWIAIDNDDELALFKLAFG